MSIVMQRLAGLSDPAFFIGGSGDGGLCVKKTNFIST
jgi:hypothetical protein